MWLMLSLFVDFSFSTDLLGYFMFSKDDLLSLSVLDDGLKWDAEPFF